MRRTENNRFRHTVGSPTLTETIESSSAHKREITIDTRGSGGWYDVTLTAPSDPSFTAEFAGRVETAARLTSDPQLGRASA